MATTNLEPSTASIYSSASFSSLYNNQNTQITQNHHLNARSNLDRSHRFYHDHNQNKSLVVSTYNQANLFQSGATVAASAAAHLKHQDLQEHRPQAPAFVGHVTNLESGEPAASSSSKPLIDRFFHVANTAAAAAAAVAADQLYQQNSANGLARMGSQTSHEQGARNLSPASKSTDSSSTNYNMPATTTLDDANNNNHQQQQYQLIQFQQQQYLVKDLAPLVIVV